MPSWSTGKSKTEERLHTCEECKWSQALHISTRDTCIHYEIQVQSSWDTCLIMHVCITRHKCTLNGTCMYYIKTDITKAIQLFSENFLQDTSILQHSGQRCGRPTSYVQELVWYLHFTHQYKLNNLRTTGIYTAHTNSHKVLYNDYITKAYHNSSYRCVFAWFKKLIQTMMFV